MNSDQNIFFRLFKLCIWIFIISGIVFYNGYSSLKEDILVSDSWFIEIPKNTSYYTLPKVLNEYSVNIPETYFKVYVRLNELPSLKAWTFYLDEGDKLEDILNSLKNPIIDEVEVTILEGWNIYDIDKMLTDKGLINKWAFIEIAEVKPSSVLVDEYNFLKDSLSLEWYIYPDTYSVFAKWFKIESFIKTALSNFDKKAYQKIEFEKPIYDTLKLASIVENEEKNPINKAMVAGILQNRIDDNTLIWADITICYPYKLTFSECTGTFIVNHLSDKNDYNTRTMVGLPKTPIWNPSYETINATVNYEKTSYYYYLHWKDWKIRYARDYSGHLYNKERYLK